MNFQVMVLWIVVLGGDMVGYKYFGRPRKLCLESSLPWKPQVLQRHEH